MAFDGNSDEIVIPQNVPSDSAVQMLAKIISNHQRRLNGCLNSLHDLADKLEHSAGMLDRIEVLESKLEKATEELEVWAKARQHGSRVVHLLLGWIAAILTAASTAYLLDVLGLR